MEELDPRTIVIIVAAVAAAGVLAGFLYRRSRRRRGERRPYIDALYALIEDRKDDALELLTRAVRSGEKDVDAFIQLGNLLREKGKAEKALQMHRTLTVRKDLSRRDEKAIQLAIAEDLAATGRTERAIETLEAIGKRSKDPDVLEALHRLYHRNGEHEKAYQVLKDLSRVDPETTGAKRSAYLVSAACEMSASGKRDRARKFLARARKEDPSSVPALYLSAMMHLEDGDSEEAVEDWKRLLEKDIDFFPEVAPRLEKSLFESSRFGLLEEILEELVDLNPDRVLPVCALAEFYAKKGEIRRGIDLLESRRSELGNVPFLTATLAAHYLREGRREEALGVLEETEMRSGEKHLWTCSECGETFDSMLEYCSACCSFDTIARDER